MMMLGILFIMDEVIRFMKKATEVMEVPIACAETPKENILPRRK